jgi:hypothetical protein
MRKLIVLLALLGLGGLIAVVIAARMTQKPSPAVPAPQDEAAIYQAVIRRLYGPDDTFGGQLAKPIVYIVRRTNDAAGDPARPTSTPQILADATQRKITAALADLPARLIWVDRFEDVRRDSDTGRVSDGGVIIQLGSLTFEHSGKAQVPASIYIAGLAAGGSTYVVERQGGSWNVTGTTGAQWIS